MHTTTHRTPYIIACIVAASTLASCGDESEPAGAVINDDTTFALTATDPNINADCVPSPCGRTRRTICDFMRNADDVAFVEITAIIGASEPSEGPNDNVCSSPFHYSTNEVKARVVYSATGQRSNQTLRLHDLRFAAFGRDVAVGDLFLISHTEINGWDVVLTHGEVRLTDTPSEISSGVGFLVPERAGDLKEEVLRIQREGFQRVCGAASPDRETLAEFIFDPACL